MLFSALLATFAFALPQSSVVQLPQEEIDAVNAIFKNDISKPSYDARTGCFTENSERVGCS
jgi:hypothetical protein